MLTRRTVLKGLLACFGVALVTRSTQAIAAGGGWSPWRRVPDLYDGPPCDTVSFINGPRYPVSPTLGLPKEPAGTIVQVKFGAPTRLIHSDSLILPNGENFTAGAKDVVVFVCEGRQRWRCIAWWTEQGRNAHS